MMNYKKKPLSQQEQNNLLKTLKSRFDKNMSRHKGVDWKKIEAKLIKSPEKLWSLSQMEKTGGEPDVVVNEKGTTDFYFYDCSPETPKERRSFCYDQEALKSRKEHKPKNSAMGLANEFGIEMLNEEEYRQLQKHGPFDTKTSSWLKAESNVRKLGGAIFGDFRFGRVFVYHNGAESYYSGRGFRGKLHV